MPFPVFRLILACLALTGIATLSHAGMNAETPYTIRGKADFDTVLQVINPYGTWSKIDGKWAYTPLDHLAPYTDGRWIYTEYGWYWKGSLPHSWATEHYGYWKRSADKVWSWYPGPYWLPQIVEIRATSKYIGWRTGAVDEDGNYVEKPIDRYSKPDEWTFVTLAQFANPITPDIVAKHDVAEAQLDDSTDCRHTYLTYREIDRAGPHPADFADLSRDGGMLSPNIFHDDPSAVPPPKPTDTNSPAVKMTGTNGPALVGTQIDPSADTRKVRYWITMSLPTYWTPPPTDAKPGEIYIYRPDFYQDYDGIERRITLWFNPKARTSLSDVFNQTTPISKSETAPASGAPAQPAVPAVPDSAANPFHSPLDDRFHGDTTPHAPATNSSSKNPVPTGAVPAPSGLSAPSGAATNAAPAR